MKEMNASYLIFKSSLATSVLAIGLCASTSVVKAASLQSFGPYTYVNPASLSQVNTFSLSAGASETFLHSKFTGTFRGNTGRSTANQNTFLPYGQIMYRIHPEWVIGADISNPGVYNAFNFKNGPITGTKTLGFSKNYSGKISYQIHDKIAIGAGIDFLQFYSYKYGIVTGPGLVTTKAHGIAPGWDAGILYKIQPTSLLYFSFHSKITKMAKGTSFLNGASTSMRVIAPLPNTYSLNFVQIFSKDWLLSLTARYIQWSTLKTFVLTRVPPPVGSIISPRNFTDTWEAQAFLRYQFASKWAGTLYLEYDGNPQPLAFRTIGFPTDQLGKGFIGVQYMPTKETQIDLYYGLNVLNTKFRNVTTNGKMAIRGHTVGLTFNYKY